VGRSDDLGERLPISNVDHMGVGEAGRRLRSGQPQDDVASFLEEAAQVASHETFCTRHENAHDFLLVDCT
jgi:hypothetical protein